jgi:hypothetical protein
VHNEAEEPVQRTHPVEQGEHAVVVPPREKELIGHSEHEFVLKI